MSSLKRDYRIGVVGLGGRGRGLAAYWQDVPGAQLVAVSDLLPNRLDQARAEIGDVACYADHQEMLADADLDVLTIGTTGQHHAAITRDACAQGIRAIYCEKPMACSLADADAMIAACRDGNTVLQIGHQRRWMGPITRVRTAIRDGAIGQPTFGYIYWSGARVGSVGTHLFDALNFMLDSQPIEVIGRLQRGLDLARVDDHPVYSTRFQDDPGVVGLITYANGMRISVDGLNDVLLYVTYLFGGSKGRIDLEEVSWQIDYRARDTDTRSHRDAGTVPARREFQQNDSEADGDAERRGYREMLDCIDSGATPSSSGEDGRLALETIDLGR